MQKKTRCGYIAIIGRPNVGKSTLLNRILGQKITITSRKAQTTRYNISGIKTNNNIQSIYVDTPGLHNSNKKLFNKYLVQTAIDAISDVDLILFLVDAFGWKEGDGLVLEHLKKTSLPIILTVNKIDKIKDKSLLLPLLADLAKKSNFAELVPISAKTGRNVDKLEKIVADLLPENDFYFSKEQITDKSERFLVAEIIREKATRLLGQELPYELTVDIEQFIEEKKIINISAVIFVEKEGQKKIIIGKKGEKLKEIASIARLDMEKLLSNKVFLKIWVKVKSP